MSDFFDDVEISTKPSETMVNPVANKSDWDFVVYCELIYNKNEFPVKDKDYTVSTISKVVNSRLRMLHHRNSEIEYSVSVTCSDESVTDKSRTNGENNEVICVEADFSGTFGSIKAFIDFMKCLNGFDACEFSDNLNNIFYGVKKFNDEKVGFTHRFYADRHYFKIGKTFYNENQFFIIQDMEPMTHCCNYLLSLNLIKSKSDGTDGKTNLVTARQIKSIIDFFDTSDTLAVTNNIKTLIARKGLYPPNINLVVFGKPPSEEYGYIEKYGFDFCDKIMHKSLSGLEDIIDDTEISISVSTIDAVSVNKYDPGKDVKTDKADIQKWLDGRRPLNKKRNVQAFYYVSTEKNVIMAGFNCGHSYDSETDKYYIHTIAICGETERTIELIKKIFK